MLMRRQTEGAFGQIWLGPLLMMAGATCIGFAPIGLRVGLDHLGPQAVAFWRFLLATPLLFALVYAVNRRAPVRPNRFVLLAGLFFGLDIAFWHAALAITTVANATFIVNLGNVSVGLAAWIFLKERPSRVWGMAICVALTGAGLLTFGGEAGGKSHLGGDSLALIAAFLVSGYMLTAKIARREMAALDVLFWVTLVEVGVAFFAVLVTGERFLPETAAGFAAPVFLAIMIQVAGQGLIIAGLGRTNAALAGVLVLIQPVVAAAVSWRLFDEPLLALQIFGAGLILGGVILAQVGGSETKPS